MHRNRSVVWFFAGVLACWGVTYLTMDGRGGGAPSGPVPSSEVAAQALSNRPISIGELETTSTPVTIPRPLEVPEVYVFERDIDAQTSQVIIVDSEKKRICVYHVDQEGIEFVANRNYTWDLTLDVYNEKGLTPSQIREYYETNQVGK